MEARVEVAQEARVEVEVEVNMPYPKAEYYQDKRPNILKRLGMNLLTGTTYGQREEAEQRNQLRDQELLLELRKGIGRGEYPGEDQNIVELGTMLARRGRVGVPLEYKPFEAPLSKLLPPIPSDRGSPLSSQEYTYEPSLVPAIKGIAPLPLTPQEQLARAEAEAKRSYLGRMSQGDLGQSFYNLQDPNRSLSNAQATVAGQVAGRAPETKLEEDRWRADLALRQKELEMRNRSERQALFSGGGGGLGSRPVDDYKYLQDEAKAEDDFIKQYQAQGVSPEEIQAALGERAKRNPAAREARRRVLEEEVNSLIQRGAPPEAAAQIMIGRYGRDLINSYFPYYQPSVGPIQNAR